MNPKPNSFWIAWYECRLTVIEITSCGKYFWALGQEEAWALQHAELIEEIDIWKPIKNAQSKLDHEKLVNLLKEQSLSLTGHLK